MAVRIFRSGGDNRQLWVALSFVAHERETTAAHVTKFLRKKIALAISRIHARRNRNRKTKREPRLVRGVHSPSATPPANVAARHTAGCFTWQASSERAFQCDVSAEKDRIVEWNLS